MLEYYLLFIIKAGLELIKESVDNMLGVRVESDLARSLKKIFQVKKKFMVHMI